MAANREAASASAGEPGAAVAGGREAPKMERGPVRLAAREPSRSRRSRSASREPSRSSTPSRRRGRSTSRSPQTRTRRSRTPFPPRRERPESSAAAPQTNYHRGKRLRTHRGCLCCLEWMCQPCVRRSLIEDWEDGDETEGTGLPAPSHVPTKDTRMKEEIMKETSKRLAGMMYKDITTAKRSSKKVKRED